MTDRKFIAGSKTTNWLSIRTKTTMNKSVALILIAAFVTGNFRHLRQNAFLN